MRVLAAAAVVLTAVTGLAAAPQDPYAGKSAAELIELCKRRLSEREPELGTTVPYEEFADKYRRTLEGRFNRVLKVWKQDGVFPSPIDQLLALGRVYRSWGNVQLAQRHFDQALRKAQQEWHKRQCHVELAFLSQLMDNEQRARGYLTQAAKYSKQVGMQQDTERALAIAKGKREYLELLTKRKDNPRDWRAQWAVCLHLMGYKDQWDLPWLVVETLVALEWLRVAFPASPPVKDGGVNFFILDMAKPARDVETGLEAAERLWQHGASNTRVGNGDLVLKVGDLLREEEESRQQAVRCYRWLQAEKPNHSAVTSGEVDKSIQALERMKGVKRETTPPPSPPWRP